MGIKCQLSTRLVPSGLAAMCTLRAMSPPKTVHINVPEKAFYLHQTDNGLNFELYFCSGFFFLLLFYSNWRSRLTILLFLSVRWSSVRCLYFLSMDGVVSIVEHSTAAPQENAALKGV